MWKCKLCHVSCSVKVHLLKHYRLQHSQYSTISPLPCLYESCMCTFRTLNSLKIHMTRFHPDRVDSDTDGQGGANMLTFSCPLCAFKQPFVENEMFLHLRGHLKNHEVVPCPFKDCTFKTNIYSTFNSHKCREHQSASEYDALIVVRNEPQDDSQSSDMEQDPIDHCTENISTPVAESSTDGLEEQLQHNLAAFFLKLQTILHVTERATQEIIEHLDQLFVLSEPLVKEAVAKILKQHNCPFSDTVLSDIVHAVSDSNVLHKSITSQAPLSTAKRRKSYYEQRFPLVKPVEYFIESSKHTCMYVPILTSLQEMLKKADVLEKVQETTAQQRGQYSSYRDGSYCQENPLLSEGQKLSLILYIDDFEVANPLGTSRKIHKVCAVYWTLANLPVKYRSSLHTIQLALLCNSNNLREFGYARVFSPLLQDLKTLEVEGVYIEALGNCVKGTVYSVVADNLAAHGLAGFKESFNSAHCCRFCLTAKTDMQTVDATTGCCEMRTKNHHDHLVHELKNGGSGEGYGVKDSCVLSDHLSYFHPITGFPPDILHDLFEGVVPVELALCLKCMISKKYFSLDDLNKAIVSFPYEHADKVDRPHPIPKTFHTRGTIGGNGHENSTLLRLLPVLIGSRVPEGDKHWEILMELKDIVELSLSHTFSDGTIEYLACKIADHRQLLQEVFPNLMLRPKHHFIEHYPHLIKCFGPLVHLWTMRFEGKHKVFKKIVHDTHNFKNVLKTLADRHQKMMAFYLSSPRFLKPSVQTTKIESVFVDSLPKDTHAPISSITQSSTVYRTNHVTVDGTLYAVGMFVCSGMLGALPEFKEIQNILLIADQIFFILRAFVSGYNEHLRSYELTTDQEKSYTVSPVHKLTDQMPLTAYKVATRLILTTKRFIPLSDLE